MKKMMSFLLLVSLFSSIRADGELDVSFNASRAGAAGSVPGLRATSDFTAGFPVLVLPNMTPKTTRAFGAEGGGLLIQPDGKLILFGNEMDAAIPTASNFFMQRYNPDGTLDSTFGAGTGRVITVPGVIGALTHGFDVVLDRDKKIIMVGTEQTPVVHNHLIARFNTDGTLDTTFGGAGFVASNFNGTRGEFFTRVVVQPDGKIVAGGFELTGVGFSLVARYNTDGTVDTTFNSGGAAPGSIALALGGTTDEQKVSDLLILGDGKILVAANNITSVAGNSDMILARLNSNGTLDTTFGPTATPGFFRSTFGAEVNAVHKIIFSQGKILLIGETGTGPGTPNGMLFRLNQDGTPDTTFGTAGRVIITAPRGFYSGALQADGKIIAVGPDEATAAVSVARLNPDGSLDTTFDTAGIVLITDSVGTPLDFGTDMAIQGDGNIVFVGYNAFAGANDEVHIGRLLVNTAAASFKTPDAVLSGKYRNLL